MYRLVTFLAATFFLVLLGALALLLHCAALYYRTLNEEKPLRTELPGFDEFMCMVRWRFIPGLW